MEDSVDLHDATLLSLSFDWPKNELRCLVRPVSPTPKMICIVFSDVQLVKIPASHPWGMSSSINSSTHRKVDAGIAINIEMQSGDTIEVLAAKAGIEE